MNSTSALLSTVVIALGAALTGPACTLEHDETAPPAVTASADTLVSVYEGQLSSSGKSWATHSLELAATGELTLQLDWTSNSADFNLFLYDPADNLVAYENTKTAKPEALSYAVDIPGTYTVGIKCKSGSGSYALTTAFLPDQIDQVFTGATSPSSSWLTHEFEASSGDEIEAILEWTDPSANLNLFLYDPDGELVTYANGTNDKPEQVAATADQTGTWTVALKCKWGATSYTLTVTLGGEPGNDPPPVPVATYPGQPPVGQVLWGAGINGNGDPVSRHESPSGHLLAVRRTFFQWSHRTGYLINVASDDHAHHRLPWVSVKTPSWSAMAAGQHDGEIDQMLEALDALSGPVWLTIHHEPEGGGGNNNPDDPAGPAGHVAMNEQVRARMTALGVDNVALAPILMAYTWKPASGRNPDEWWKPGIYDFVGIDHYQESEASLLTSTWSEIRQWAAARSVDVAVGEWGMRGTDYAAGQRVHEWYDHAAGSDSDGGGARVVGLCAFDSGLNSPSGSWELQGAQLTAFRQLMGDPRTANVVP